MKPVTIESVKGRKRKFAFLGWRDDGLAFYATETDGQPAIVEPVIAYTDDRDSGEPYRFPRVVPLEITRLEIGSDIAWSAHHRAVLQLWRDVKMGEADALTKEELFKLDVIRNKGRPRSPEEIERAKRDEKDKVERYYKRLVDTPLLELLHPFQNAGMLDPFLHGRWADEMGEDFMEMSRAANGVLSCWLDDFGDHPDYQEFLFALRNVRFVMRGEDGSEYPLLKFEVRKPTDREAQAYQVMQKLTAGTTGSQVRRQSAKHLDKPNRRARFEKDFTLAVITQPKGEPLRLTIEPELGNLIKRIINAGGSIPRTALRKDKSDTYQPEKLLRSEIAETLQRAGLLGTQRNGRTTVFWAKVKAD